MVTEENVFALKTAVKKVVHEVGGLAAAASCSRVGISQLSDYGNVASDKMVPVDVALDLEMIGGSPHITAQMARLHGYQLMPCDGRPMHELIPALQRIALDNGALFAKTVHILSGGAVSTKERNELASTLADIARASAEALAALEEQ